MEKEAVKPASDDEPQNRLAKIAEYSMVAVGRAAEIEISCDEWLQAIDGKAGISPILDSLIQLAMMDEWLKVAGGRAGRVYLGRRNINRVMMGGVARKRRATMTNR